MSTAIDLSPRSSCALARRTLALVTAASLWLPAALAEDGDTATSAQEASSGMELRDELKADGQAAVKAVFHIDANPDAVYRTLRDSTRFPEFMPQTREVRVLESGPGYQITSFLGGEGLFESKLTMKRIIDDRARRISWSLIEGRPRSVSGFWQVEPAGHGAGSTVVYSNRIDLGFWAPSGIVRHFARQNLRAIAENLRKRVESGGVWQSAEYLERTRGRSKWDIN